MDFKELINKLDIIASKKILLENGTLVSEAPINDTGYDPDKVQYAYQDGKANPNWPGNKPPAGPDTSNYIDPRGTDNVTNDPNKPVDPNKKKPGGSGKNAGTRAFQHWLNAHGIKVAVDGVWGPETAAGNDKYFNTNVYGKKMPKEQQDEYEAMRGVGTAHNVRVTPGSGNMYIGSPEYLSAMKKYGYDPKTGNPVGGTKTSTSANASSTATTPAPNQAAQPMNDNAIVGTLFKAMSGAGTDEAAVFRALGAIQSPEQFKKVDALYKQIAGEDLMAAIKGDFMGYDLFRIQDMMKKFQPQAESAELDIIRKLSGM